MFLLGVAHHVNGPHTETTLVSHVSVPHLGAFEFIRYSLFGVPFDAPRFPFADMNLQLHSLHGMEL